MIEQLINLWPELNKSFIETLIMVGIGLGVAVIAGLPLGLLLFVTDRDLFLENKWIKGAVGIFVTLSVLFHSLSCLCSYSHLLIFF